MDNANNVIKEIFKNEIQIKRVTKEFQQLEILKKEDFKITLKTLNENLQIIVEMPPMNQLNQERPILFGIYLDNRFPFVFPRVHILSQLTKPSLSDGRDYIDNIIGGQWSPQLLLYEIVKLFPEFLEKIRVHQNNKEYLLTIGKYQENTEYDTDIGLDDVEYFQCKEIINGKQYPRVIQLSDSHFLNLENQGKQYILLTTYCVKDLLKVDKVQRSILLTWRTKDGSQTVQTITSSNLDQMYDSLTVFKLGLKGKKINQNDVTLQKFESITPEQLQQQVNNSEAELQQNLNNISLNKLMATYQQAIEYYSAYSDEDYKQYVTRLQSLLGREDVQTILANSMVNSQ